MIRFVRVLKNVLLRGWLLYLLVGLLLFKVLDHERLQVKILNELRVPIDYLILFSRGEAPLQRGRLVQQLDYYQKLSTIFSDSAEAPGILGFCEYYLGNTERAIGYFQEARIQGSDIFWFPYNLGLIYYWSGDYSRAAEFFRESLTKNMQVNHAMILLSLIYRNYDDPLKNVDGIVPNLQDLDVEQMVRHRLRDGYEDALRYLVLSFKALGQDAAVIQTAQMALRQDVRDKIFFYYEVGAAAARMGQDHYAIAPLTECVLLNPQHRPALLLLAECYENLQDVSVAQFFLDRAQAAPVSDQEPGPQERLVIF